MGRSIAIKYVLNLSLVDAVTRKPQSSTPQQWRVKAQRQSPGFGKPSEANIAVWVKGFEASTAAGGVNAHLGALQVTAANIVDQESGTVVAQFKA